MFTKYHVEASKSEKITKEHMKCLLHSLLNVCEKSLLLHDFWSGHRPQSDWRMLSQPECYIKNIATEDNQILLTSGCIFFRQCKLYARNLVDFVCLQVNKPQMTLNDRYFIICLHSVLQPTFCIEVQ